MKRPIVLLISLLMGLLNDGDGEIRLKKGGDFRLGDHFINNGVTVSE